ncbi:MAG: MFS transporter [Chloroflexi bacterium]|nr:MFS transporter [Chloroflexota bacterium]
MSATSAGPDRRWGRTLPQRTPFFYGWVVVAVAYMANVIAYSAPVFALFIVPIEQETGWNRTQLALTSTVSTLLGVVITPLFGRLVDRFGARLLLAFGGVAAGVGFVAVSQVHNLLAFYMLYGLTNSALIAGLGTVVTGTAVSQWFVRMRGRALGFIAMGSSTGGIVMIPIVAWVMAWRDWRAAMIAWGVMAVLLMTIPAVIFMRRRPEDYGLEPDGGLARTTQGQPGRTRPRIGTPWLVAGGLTIATMPTLLYVVGVVPSAWNRGHALDLVMSAWPTVTVMALLAWLLVRFKPREAAKAASSEVSFTLSQARRTRPFWMIMLGFLFASAGLGYGFHAVPHMLNLGHSRELATQAWWAFFIATFAAKFPWGFLLERMSARWAAVLWVAGEAVGVVLLLNAHSVPMLFLATIVLGVGHGPQIPLTTFIWANYFGRQNVGTIRGAMAPFTVPVGALVPPLGGIFFDAFGNYTLYFSAQLVLLAIAVFCFYRVPAPAAPEAAPMQVAKTATMGR